MNNQIFRKKSLEKIASPEQLNDYVRVSNPAVWMILTAVVVLLIGVCVWGVFGRLETKLNTAGTCKNGRLVCYVKESDVSSLNTGMSVEVNGKRYPIVTIASTPALTDSVMDSYALHINGLAAGEWVSAVTANADLADGTYRASVITESVSPMSFVLN